MTKTEFAIRLLMEAYAEDGVVNLPNMFEGFMYKASELASTFGTLEDDDQKLRLNNDQPTLLIFETIADIAYNAGRSGFDSGDSRADIQHFIHLARVFEEETKYVDWDAEDGVDYITEIDDFIHQNLTVRNKLEFSYPNGAKQEWDNIEIHACKQDEDNTYPVDTDEEADFFTVYLHPVEGGCMAVADLPTREHAEQLGELIHNAVLSFKDNGYMALNRLPELHRQFNLYINERIHNAHNSDTKAAYEVVRDFFNQKVKS